MNRKYNPFVSLVALLLLALILVLTCTGCRTETAEPARFTVQNVKGTRCKIITDNETGEQYLYYFAGYGGGLAKMEG